MSEFYFMHDGEARQGKAKAEKQKLEQIKIGHSPGYPAWCNGQCSRGLGPRRSECESLFSHGNLLEGRSGTDKSVPYISQVQ